MMIEPKRIEDFLESVVGPLTPLPPTANEEND